MARNDLDRIAYNKFADGEITLTEYIEYQNRDKIMEKKEAMKILKDFRDKSALFSVRTALDTIIPELKESEDEKVRKALIEMVHDTTGDELWGDYNVHKEDALAWLEEQGETFTRKDVDGAYLKGMCDTKHELEKQGNINETINRDKLAQGVLRGAAINLITWIDYNAAEGNMCLSNMECKDIEDALVSGNWDKIYAYIKKKLEKQGEQPKEATYTHEVETGNGNIKALVTEKVQLPKFKVGDTVCKKKDNSFCATINSITDTVYLCEVFDSDGDYEDDYAFLISEQDEYELVAKKIENEIEIPFSAKDSELQEVTYYIPKGFHAEIDDDKVVIKKGEKLAEWSGEDEEMLTWLCRIVHSQRLGEEITLKEEMELGKWMDKWLNHNPQPHREWGEEDKARIKQLLGWLDTLKNYIHYDALVSLELRRERIDKVSKLESWLKSFKQRIGQGLNPNDVIAWLKPYGCVVDDIVEQFKKDFGL